MQELIEYIARSLVDDPTQVHVSQARRGPVVGCAWRGHGASSAKNVVPMRILRRYRP
jgi:hypothetical protein